MPQARSRLRDSLWAGFSLGQGVAVVIRMMVTMAPACGRAWQQQLQPGTLSGSSNDNCSIEHGTWGMVHGFGVTAPAQVSARGGRAECHSASGNSGNMPRT